MFGINAKLLYLRAIFTTKKLSMEHHLNILVIDVRTVLQHKTKIGGQR